MSEIILTDKELPDIHLSPSQMNMYSRCQQAWVYRYIFGMKTQPTKHLTAGSVYDDALTNNFQQKIKSKVDLSEQEILDIADTSFSIREDETEWYGESPAETKDTVIGLIKEYVETGVAESIDPAVTQKVYDVHFEGMDWTIKGISDVEEVNGRIIDNKTTGASPSTDLHKLDQGHKLQMDIYGISKKYTEGGDWAPRRLDYAVKLKTPRIVQIELPPLTPEDVKFFQKKVSAQFQQMEMLRQDKMKPDTNRTHFMCSQKMCGYWRRCVKDNGGTVKP